MSTEPPSIHLYAHSGVAADQLTELLLGIEEEGVPVAVTLLDQADPLILAHQAATSSRLGVGVGVAYDYAVVTLEKLPPEQPYQASWLNRAAAADRIIGSNAARLVKRIPLRSYGAERSSR